MTDNFTIPDFLNRNLNKGNTMNTHTSAPTPAATPKKKRQDAYIARLTIQIPVSLTDADSVPEATLAIKEIQAKLPAGAVVEIVSTAFGKMPA